MLMSIENDRMNNLTMNFMTNNSMNIKWKNNSIEESKFSKLLGLPTFARMSDSNGIDSAHIDILKMAKNPITRKARKSVRFAPQLSTKMPESPKLWYGSLTEEHCSELWYQKQELSAIKHAAKVAIANRTKAQADELVGLERFSKQRAVWKKSAIRCVMMAQNQINSLDGSNANSKAEYIKRISTRCTAWARDEAKKQGFNDYCAVHDPLAALFSDNDDSDTEDENKENYNELIFGETTVSNKRKIGAAYACCNEHDALIDSGRRTRHRVSPPLVL